MIDKDKVLREAKMLVSLQEPNHGGPYEGSAAFRFVEVMKELIALVESDQASR